MRAAGKSTLRQSLKKMPVVGNSCAANRAHCLQLPVRFAARQYVEAVGQCTGNAFPLSVAQVEQQFFDAAPCLNPGVSPAHDAVNALFIGNVFDDVAGMFQWKIHLIALHREDAAVTFGQKGYVRQDVYERFGSNAWARIMARSADGSSGRANGKWSPDSVWESGCIEFNN